MKLFIVYQGPKEFYHAMLVQEDGHVLADHCCSHPGYMYGDLYGNRAERKAR